MSMMNDDKNEYCRDTEDELGAAAKRFLGVDYLFPYQRLVTGNILEAARAGAGHDEDGAARGRQIVVLPTGAGKSLCFQLPAMLLDGPTLVIYPLLSLMADQERRLSEKNFEPVTLRGGQGEQERAAIWEKLRSGRSRFIIANPEVLLSPSVLSRLPELGIAHLVIDEAHCVSEWGESFRPSYLELRRVAAACNAPVITAFTATASNRILEKIERVIFGEEGAHRIMGNPDRPNISYAAVGCVLRDIAVRDILAVCEKPAIVFCSSRLRTEQLARYLRGALGNGGIRFYHAGLTREEKTGIEKWFFASQTGILTATCAYGMGVDKAGIRTVIHRDYPPSVEAYLQETGRAGRDGGFSRAFLLWGPGDGAAADGVPNVGGRKQPAALTGYARDNVHCRREALLRLLNYEGENAKPETECCDVCAQNARSGLREEKPVLGFFGRNRRAWSLHEAGDILSLSGGLAWSKEDALTAIRYFIKNGRLKELKHLPWRGKITIPRGTEKERLRRSGVPRFE